MLDPKQLREDHQKKLFACDGLLLYWDKASEAWFETTKADLDQRDFKSRAIATVGTGRVDDPLDYPVIPLPPEGGLAAPSMLIL